MSFTLFTELYSHFSFQFFFNFIICMDVTEHSMGNVALGSLEVLNLPYFTKEHPGIYTCLTIAIISKIYHIAYKVISFNISFIIIIGIFEQK